MILGEKKNRELRTYKFLKKWYRFFKKVYFLVFEKFRDGWRQRGQLFFESVELGKRKKIDFGKEKKNNKFNKWVIK